MQTLFQKFLIVSILAHLLILLVVVYSPSFQRAYKPSNKVTWVKFSYGHGGTNIKAATKSLKHMPKSTLLEQKKAIKERKKAGEHAKANNSKSKVGKDTVKIKANNKNATKVGKTVKIGGKKTKSKIDSKMDDALARVAALQKQRNVEIGAAQTKTTNTGQSPDGGEEGTKAGQDLIVYYNKVRRKISKQWIVIKSDFAGSLVSRIVVRIDVNGNIIDTRYKRSSGDGSFDASALRAIKRATPFPIPPGQIRQDLMKDGFEFVFNPKSVSGRVL